MDLQGAGVFRFRDVRIFKDQSLGIGSYGAVYRGLCDQLPCAAKVLHPILCQSRDPREQRAMERFEQECAVLRGIIHPRIVQHLGTSVDPDTGLAVLLMELMEESLTVYLERSPRPLPYHIQVTISRDIALAVAYLHDNGIVHRDLSSNNILLCGERAKVTDLGMALLMDMSSQSTHTACPGTQSYMPPEALQDHPTYSEKIDCFSIGVLNIQIITRRFPNPGPRWAQLEDTRSPTGMSNIPILEAQRRDNHIHLIDPAHPLLSLGLICIKDESNQRPSAAELCVQLAMLQNSPAFRESQEESQRERGASVLEDVVDKQERDEDEGGEEGEEIESNSEGEGERDWENGGERGEEESRERILLLEGEVYQLRQKLKRQEKKIQTMLTAIEERETLMASVHEDSAYPKQEDDSSPTLTIYTVDVEPEEEGGKKLQNLYRLLRLKDQAIRRSVALEKESEAANDRLRQEVATLTETLKNTRIELDDREKAFGHMRKKAEELQLSMNQQISLKDEERRAVDARGRDLQWRLREASAQAEEKTRLVEYMQSQIQQLKVKLAEEQTNSSRQSTVLTLRQKELLQVKCESQLVHRQLEEKEVCIRMQAEALQKLETESTTNSIKGKEGEGDGGGGGELRRNEDNGWKDGNVLEPKNSRENHSSFRALMHTTTGHPLVHAPKPDDSDASSGPEGSKSSDSEEDEEGEDSKTSWTVVGFSRGPTCSFSLGKNSRCYPAPFRMSRGSLAMGDSVVYFKSESWHDRYQAYNIHKGVWLPSPWSQLNLSGCSLVMVNGKPTVIGGYEQWHISNPTGSLLSKSETNDTSWSEVLPPMPTKRYWTTAVSSGHHLIVAGGHSGLHELSTVEVFDVDSQRWHTSPNLPTPLTNASGVVCHDQLHIAGGLSNNSLTTQVYSCFLQDLLLTSSLRRRIKKAFSPSVTRKNIWKKSSLPDLPVSQTTLVTLRGHLLAVGGCTQINTPTDAIFIFRPGSYTWEVFGRLRCARRLCFAAVLPTGYLLVAGGYTSAAGDTSLVEMIPITEEEISSS